jgi:hypothetical protein
MLKRITVYLLPIGKTVGTGREEKLTPRSIGKLVNLVTKVMLPIYQQNGVCLRARVNTTAAKQAFELMTAFLEYPIGTVEKSPSLGSSKVFNSSTLKEAKAIMLTKSPRRHWPTVQTARVVAPIQMEYLRRQVMLLFHVWLRDFGREGSPIIFAIGDQPTISAIAPNDMPLISEKVVYRYELELVDDQPKLLSAYYMKL